MKKAAEIDANEPMSGSAVRALVLSAPADATFLFVRKPTHVQSPQGDMLGRFGDYVLRAEWDTEVEA